MAERRAGLRQGWSALAHAHRSETPFLQAPVIPSLSRELSVPDPSQFAPLSLHPPPPKPPPILSFASVVKKPHIPDPATNLHPNPAPLAAPLAPSSHDTFDPPCLVLQDAAVEHSHAQAVSRLHARHAWADPSLISDILESLDLDEDSASAFLVSMANDNMQRVSTGIDAAECCPSSQTKYEGEGNSGQAWAIEENCHGPDAEGNEGAEGKKSFLSRNLVPIEPEWEEDDVYLRSRRNALRMSRASGKHARGAYRAFISGDYSKAKILSKQAREERVEAEKLHVVAAKQILQARNGETIQDLWKLDLHGLHVNEAVAALQQRLLEIETGISNSRYVQDGRLPQKSTEDTFKGSVLQGSPLSKELKVITGVGNHSRGGGSLPVAIKNFLIQNRYKFEEVKPGVVVIHPKFLLFKGK